MQSERTIRLIITPALFAAWLLYGAWLNCKHEDLISPFRTKDGENALALIVGGGLLLAVAGYVMSLITVILFQIVKWATFLFFDVELRVNNETLTKMRDRLEPSAPLSSHKIPIIRRNRLPIIVSYQSFFWPDDAKKWAERRWMNVGICANGIVAVASALAIGGWKLDYTIGPEWAIASAVLIGLFLVQLFVARYQLGRLHWVAARWGVKKDGKV